jgi:hypothetical protein
MPRIGRPTKLTAALQTALADAVRLGLPLAKACDRAGVGFDTAKEWVRRGEGTDDRPPSARYASFALAIRKARADDQARRIARLEQAAKGGVVNYRRTTTRANGETVSEERFTEGQWTADAWYLERSDPENWGRKDRVAVTGEGGKPLEVIVKVLGAGTSMDDL